MDVPLHENPVKSLEVKQYGSKTKLVRGTWAQVSAYTEFKFNSYERCFITSGDSSAHYGFHFTIPDDQKSFYLNFELPFSFEEDKWRGPFDNT
ncbi:hypothetical protein RhiirC2_785780 [Rhizophagus irregularis]|uniref:Uncharacterized protein n=1 Tax=Rhizophagus irregularis TaxID=588596 RepID=A0A2N1MVQ1_9GLOM|nr:hypothetical protein RhiirC2_785780 [Rhizophagus irregularis]